MRTIVDFQEKFIIQVPDKVRPALCLDFDGTIRYSRTGEFINSPDDVVLFEGVEEKIWEYRKEGYLIFGITNQGGIAYGIKSPEEDQDILDATLHLFDKHPFHIVRTCYHHPEGRVEPYNHRSLLRKPEIGMLVLCEVDAWEKGYIVDWEGSLFVGDRQEDKLCAKNAGIAFRWADDFFGREKG